MSRDEFQPKDEVCQTEVEVVGKPREEASTNQANRQEKPGPDAARPAHA